MKLEHFAINVQEPHALAEWYAEHLGLRIVRMDNHPPYITFLADDHSGVMIEVYSNANAEYVDYASMHPTTFHIAFAVEDMGYEQARLLAAGASHESETIITPGGDELSFLRDPWGNTIQLAKRMNLLQ